MNPSAEEKKEMVQRKIWSFWILLLGILVTFAGLALAIIVPFFLPIIQDIFYHSFSSGSTIENIDPNNLHHINWIYGVLGGVMLGWGIVISMLAYQNLKTPQSWIWNVILVSVISWYVVDTSISVYYAVIPNIILNTCILLLAVIPILFEKIRTRDAKN